MADYDMSIHTNPDARAWAKFYTECRSKSPDPSSYDDEEMMVTWFSNAMMAMHDHMRRLSCRTVAQLLHSDGEATALRGDR